MTLWRTAAKLSLFVVGSLLASVLVVNTLTNPVSGPTNDYHAIFTDATGLVSGSDVLVAGVRVGAVDSVSLRDGRADVTFEVRGDQRVPAGAQAVIRYADLLGARYLVILPGTGGGDLPAGETIPVERTQPALDLASLFNGFKPLFDAIDPKQVNQLAAQLVAVFQGESGTITELLNRIIAVTTNLAGRDKVIGAVLTNLNTVLDTVAAHRDDLHQLVDGLARLTSAVAASHQQVAEAIDAAGALTGSLNGLFTGLVPTLTHDVNSMNSVAATLVRNQDGITKSIQGLPDLLTRVNRITDYGSWANVYVCNLSVTLGGQPIDLGAGPHTEVCR